MHFCYDSWVAYIYVIFVQAALFQLSDYASEAYLPALKLVILYKFKM